VITILLTFPKTNKEAIHSEEIEGFGYCRYHETSIDESTYKWKGCWGCYHFARGKDYPYVTVYEASEIFNVSENTIRRWIKKGKLKAHLFEQGRHTIFLPSPRKYHIEKQSIENLLKTNKSTEQIANKQGLIIKQSTE